MKVVELPVKAKRFKGVHSAVQELNTFAAKELAANQLWDAAIIATKRVIHVSPTSAELWNNLGTYLYNIQQYEEGIACLERALSINPDYAPAHMNIGLIYATFRKFAEAESEYTRAYELDSSYKSTLWNRSMLRLSTGDWKGGFEDYESRIVCRKDKYDRKVYPDKLASPWYNGESLWGKTIYVASEQGIGDAIMFSRWLPWLKEQVGQKGKIFICCRADVVNLLWGFRDIVEFLPEGVPTPESDFSIMMGSLPYFAGTTLDTLPADPGLIRSRVLVQHRNNPAPAPQPHYGSDRPYPVGLEPFKVGICWTGNPQFDRNEERSVPFAQIMRVCEHPRVWAYSFQVGPASTDIQKFGGGQLVCDLSPMLQSGGLAVCGSALMQMDLVITSCTSIAHLCGVLGVPCWVLLCYDPYWVWMQERGDSPWYPKTVRLFRQTLPGNWGWVMRDVLSDLHKLLKEGSEP